MERNVNTQDIYADGSRENQNDSGKNKNKNKNKNKQHNDQQ